MIHTRRKTRFQLCQMFCDIRLSSGSIQTALYGEASYFLLRRHSEAHGMAEQLWGHSGHPDAWRRPLQVESYCRRIGKLRCTQLSARYSLLVCQGLPGSGEWNFLLKVPNVQLLVNKLALIVFPNSACSYPFRWAPASACWLFSKVLWS